MSVGREGGVEGKRDTKNLSREEGGKSKQEGSVHVSYPQDT